MELKEKDQQQPTSINWTATVKHLNDLYRQRIKYRDPLKESEARINTFQSEWMRNRFGTGRNPDIAVIHPNYTLSENDLHTNAASAPQQTDSGPALGGHVSD